MYKKIICLLLFIIAVSMQAKSYDDDLPPLGIDTMKIVSYTKEFAKRFGLPDKNISTELKNGLQAVEFSVEKEEWGSYLPYFKLYFDDDPYIRYPRDSKSGNMDNFRYHMFSLKDTTIKWINDKDLIYSSDNWMPFDNLIYALETDPDNGELKRLSSAHVEEFQRNLLPDLTYMQFWIDDNSLPSDNENVYNVMISKKSAAESINPQKFKKFNYVIYQIPKSMCKKIAGFNILLKPRNKIVHRRLDRDEKKDLIKKIEEEAKRIKAEKEKK